MQALKETTPTTACCGMKMDVHECPPTLKEALEDLDERDPTGLRQMKINQSAQPHDIHNQAFFERTQQPGIRSSSNHGPHVNKIQMNANPAYYQVMYNEMV